MAEKPPSLEGANPVAVRGTQVLLIQWQTCSELSDPRQMLQPRLRLRDILGPKNELDTVPRWPTR